MVPTMILFGVFAFVAHDIARRNLEDELSTRLASIASIAATRIRGKYLVGLEAGDEEERAYQNVVRTLGGVAKASGITRAYIFDRQFRSRADTQPGVELGAKYFQVALNRHELIRVFQGGEAVSSILFEGADGRAYKSGYAPVRASETEPEIVLAVGVDAPAGLTERLARLRRSLIFYGVGLAVLVLIVTVVVAALITRPVRRLAQAAERIGQGELDKPIPRGSRDELGVLAATMEKMRSDLRVRDERMQLMLSGIAHEVRNPLGGIELFAGILRDELPPDDERRAHVTRIETELAYLKAVVSEFLDYARRPPPELAVVLLDELVTGVVDLLRGEAEELHVRLVADADRVACMADLGQLRRAVLNLGRNAIQVAAHTADREVRVVATTAGRFAELSVTNRGPAIPDDVRERLFEPFFTTREKGTGLGLAFVKEIVNDHDGEIIVETSEEAGTTFVLRFQRIPHDQD